MTVSLAEDIIIDFFTLLYQRTIDGAYEKVANETEQFLTDSQ